jgi:hypothetical protein
MPDPTPPAVFTIEVGAEAEVTPAQPDTTEENQS